MKEEKSFKPKLVKVYNYSEEVKEVLEIDYTCPGRKGGRKGRKSEEVSVKDRKTNIRRVKRNCRRLALANDLGQVHMVLTYKENMQDIDKADKHFKYCMAKLRNIYPSLKYLATREYQERGAVHYHVLLNQRVDYKKASEIWKHGYIYLVSHKNKIAAVLYVLKYISKEVGEERMTTKKGYTKKAYLSSQGLKRELEGCTLTMLINRPEDYVQYKDRLNFMMTNLTEGWDIPFEVEIEDKKTGKNRILQGRSVLRCAKNNY